MTITGPMKALFRAAILLPLAACSSTPEPRVVVETRIERQQIPADLLTCLPAPAVPVAESQRDVARYLVDLAEAGEDCRAKLAGVRGLVD